MELDTARVSTKDIARALGMTDENVRLRFKAGVFRQTARGKYDLFETLRAEREHQRKSVRGPIVSIETARLKRAQAERAELENQLRRSEVIPSDDVKVALSEILVTLVGMLDGLGSRLAAKLASETDPAQIRRLILDETRRIREHASGRLAGMVPAGLGLGPAAATAKQNTGPVGGRKPRTAARKRRARSVQE